jgi:hypothetical protein
MTKHYRKRGGQGLNRRSSFDPPKVFTMDRDIENQIPVSKGDLRYSESGDLIPPPPPYNEVRKKTSQEPQVIEEAQDLDDIDSPFGERTFVGPQQKTSIRSLKHDIEAPLQNNQEFSGLDKDSGYGIYDDQFDGGKLRRASRNRRKRISNKSKMKTRRNKKRKSNRKNKK